MSLAKHEVSSLAPSYRPKAAATSSPQPASVIRVAFLIRSLEAGGAERQLVALARGLDRRAFAPTVITFYAGGALEAELAAAEVPLVCLHKRGRWDLLGSLARLRRALGRLDPQILHGYLAGGNLMAMLGRLGRTETKLVWGRRASAFDYRHYDRTLGLAENIEQGLARYCDLVIANSQGGRAEWLEAGVPAERIVVVPNGIDTERFRPLPEARAGLRAAWGIAPEAPLIGLVARLDPMKGHGLFLEAAAVALGRRPELRFVCVGRGAEAPLQDLRDKASALGIAGRIVWAGPRHDMPEVLSALDLHTSASLFGEGFSNAVGESMAAGVPNVVTDVGDSASIVGETGLVVPPANAAALATAWLALLDRAASEGDALRARCRARIVERYSLAAMIERTAMLYRDLIDGDEH